MEVWKSSKFTSGRKSNSAIPDPADAFLLPTVGRDRESVGEVSIARFSVAMFLWYVSPMVLLPKL
jgi:hypothetical protein